MNRSILELASYDSWYNYRILDYSRRQRVALRGTNIDLPPNAIILLNKIFLKDIPDMIKTDFRIKKSESYLNRDYEQLTNKNK
jgi:hypothetical protein